MEVGSSSLPGTTRKENNVSCLCTAHFGGLAQLARAPALQAGGQRFESVILHTFTTKAYGMKKVKRDLLHIDTRQTVEKQNQKKEYSWKYERLCKTEVGIQKLSITARRESKKGRMADALAHRGDEGRDKLR